MEIDISELDTDNIKKFDTDMVKNIFLNFLVPIICLGVIGILLFLVILPISSNSSELKAELDQKTKKNTTLQSKKDTLDKLIDFEAVVAENTNLFRKALPEEAMVPELLTQVDAIAKESGLEVVKLSNSISKSTSSSNTKEETIAPFQVVIVSLGVSGTYEQMRIFNSNLENSSRLIEVTDFRFSSASDDDNTYSATFVLNSPYLSITTEAVTDESISVDVSDDSFLYIVNEVKDLKHYDIVASQEIIDDLEEQENEQTEDAEETEPEQVEQTTEQQPE